MAWQLLPNGSFRGLTDTTLNATLGNPLPQFFLSGDGHRHPPFSWAESCPSLKYHFMGLLATRTLCAHVELHQQDVRDDSVPAFLNPLIYEQKVFGWELSIYKQLLPVMELCTDLASNIGLLGPTPAVIRDVVLLDKGIVQLDALLWQVGSPAALKKTTESLTYRKYYEGVGKGGQRNMGTEQEFLQFVLAYNNAAMRLRTDANQYIAQNIWKKIQLHPHDTHLITVGAAHITTNPV
jgi:hypothetical protein